MDEASDSDGLHDSLDDTNVQDSGVGSSSERQPHAKVKSYKLNGLKDWLKGHKYYFDFRSQLGHFCCENMATLAIYYYIV